MSGEPRKLDGLLVIAGAIGGGILGHLIFFWVAGQGFYAMVVPGFVLGLGAAMFRCPSKFWAIICGVGALGFGLYTEWRFAPFRVDKSLGYFLGHLHELEPMTWIMILVGGGIGFWLPFRRIAS